MCHHWNPTTTSTLVVRPILRRKLFSPPSKGKKRYHSSRNRDQGSPAELLSDNQKNELALYAAERGLLVFRDQYFVHQSPYFLKQYDTHFGRLHVHSFGYHAAGHREILSNLCDSNKAVFDHYSAGMLTTTRWHSDTTYERYSISSAWVL
jgi:alpha-ketoglutarate-dependent taurine dioxygenase